MTISKTDFVAYLENHKASGYQVKSVMSGCYIDPETRETRIGKTSIRLSEEQVYGLASSYIFENTFKSDVTEKAKDTFVSHLQAGNCGLVPAENQTSVKSGIPESISDLDADTISRLIGNKEYTVKVPVFEALRMGYSDVFTKKEKDILNAHIESEQKNQRIYSLFSEYFGNHKYTLESATETEFTVGIRAPMERAGAIIGKIHASSDRGFEIQGKPDFVDSGRTDASGQPIYEFAAVVLWDSTKSAADDATEDDSDNGNENQESDA